MTWVRSRQRCPAINRYHKAHGVMDFSLYEEFEGGLPKQRTCIVDHFKHLKLKPTSADLDLLGRIDPTILRPDRFLGDWYSSERGKLLAHGTWRTSDGRELTSPSVEELAEAGSNGGSHGIPEIGERGQFAYAFYATPYGLRSKGRDLQEMFDELWAVISPADADRDHLDWSSAQLASLFAPYFEAGSDWWGMFLYTIHIRTNRRLWVISASTTD